jgi:hypothetical protein
MRIEARLDGVMGVDLPRSGTWRMKARVSIGNVLACLKLVGMSGNFARSFDE